MYFFTFILHFMKMCIHMFTFLHFTFFAYRNSYFLNLFIAIVHFLCNIFLKKNDTFWVIFLSLKKKNQ